MRTIAPRLFALALLTCALLPTELRAQVAAWPSFRKLVSSNGFAPVVYDLDARRLVSFRENLYRFPAPGRETRELLFDLYLGARVGGTSRWLTQAPILEAGYEVGTGLIRTVQEVDGLRVTTHAFAPFGLEARGFAVIAQVENLGPAREDVALFSLHNFHVGGGPSGVLGERIVWDPARSAYIESSDAPQAAAGAILVKPLSPAKHGASPENPFARVEAGAGLVEVEDSGVRDDAVSGFELALSADGRLGPNARAEVAFVVVYAPDRDLDAAMAAIEAWAGDLGPSALIEAERARWRKWHAAGLEPHTKNEAEARVAAQSRAMLRMGQVREPGTPRGALIASLAPGRWDIAWVRDGLYAIDALARSGHLDEAEAGLEFLMRGPFGEYEAYVGRPYGLSVARYYGDGREESDWNDRGPNIELDGFGLFLETFARVVRARGDAALYRRHRAMIDALIADVLVHFRDPETGLIAADSSIWESHWENGGRQRWTFTSGTAVRGLDAWSELIASEEGGSDPKVRPYREAADQIRAAMARYLVAPSGAFAASAEQLRRSADYADAQAALILGTPRFEPGSRVGLATLDLLRDRLFLGHTTARGYKRNDDGDTYDQREWVVIDLGISRALRGAGRTAQADALLDWITSLGDQNFGLLPELLDEHDARYAGEVPMIGFGAGAYLTTLIERGGLSAPEKPPLPEDAGRPPMDAGGPDDVASKPEAPAEVAPPDAGVEPERGREVASGVPSERGCGCAALGPVASREAVGAELTLLFGLLAACRRRRP